MRIIFVFVSLFSLACSEVYLGGERDSGGPVGRNLQGEMGSFDVDVLGLLESGHDMYFGVEEQSYYEEGAADEHTFFISNDTITRIKNVIERSDGRPLSRRNAGISVVKDLATCSKLALGNIDESSQCGADQCYRYRITNEEDRISNEVEYYGCQQRTIDMSYSAVVSPDFKARLAPQSRSERIDDFIELDRINLRPTDDWSLVSSDGSPGLLISQWGFKSGGKFVVFGQSSNSPKLMCGVYNPRSNNWKTSTKDNSSSTTIALSDDTTKGFALTHTALFICDSTTQSWTEKQLTGAIPGSDSGELATDSGGVYYSDRFYGFVTYRKDGGDATTVTFKVDVGNGALSKKQYQKSGEGLQVLLTTKGPLLWDGVLGDLLHIQGDDWKKLRSFTDGYRNTSRPVLNHLGQRLMFDMNGSYVIYRVAEDKVDERDHYLINWSESHDSHENMMVVWGGDNTNEGFYNDGFFYNTDNNRKYYLPVTEGSPEARAKPLVLWNGTDLFVWGGCRSFIAGKCVPVEEGKLLSFEKFPM